MITRECHEHRYTCKLDNLAKMNKFFKKHKPSKLPQKEINKLNNPDLLKKSN